MRADAEQNRGRLLAVAGEVFARDGAGASLKGVARAAEVGIGTLYRHFPTRDALVEAVYEDQVDRLCAGADELLDRRDPAEALRAWMERFVDFMAAKEGMGDTLKGLLMSESDRLRTRARLREAIATLLAAAGADRDAGDVLLALGGITVIAGEENARDLASRLISLLLYGVLGSPEVR